MSYEADVRSLAELVHSRMRDVFVHATNGVQQSIVKGSELTGAPGQPVRTGDLRASFIPDPVEEWVWRTTTNVVYAEAIENGQQEPYTLPNGAVVSPSAMTRRSTVGGFHSVKMTRAGWQPLVNDAVKRVVPG